MGERPGYMYTRWISVSEIYHNFPISPAAAAIAASAAGE